jgi:hypothetical protein
MNRTIRIVSGSLSAAVPGLRPAASRTQVTDTRSPTAEQVRARFIRAGHVAGAPTAAEDGAAIVTVDDAAFGLTGWPRLRVYALPTTPPRLPDTPAHIGVRQRIATAPLATATLTVH